MHPSENNDDHGAQKPPKRYLRKGEGTARFRMASNERRFLKEPGPSQRSLIESPAISLPRFTPSSCIPTSARTADSGISNEDDTRPPTTASLPMDNQSSSPSNNCEPQNRATPTVIEEHSENGHDSINDEHIERVSAIPTFVPDEGVSSLINPCSEVSDDAAFYREQAERLKKQAPNPNSLKSFSFTPSSYASNISEPPNFHSTPITHEEEEIIFHPPPLVPSSYHTTGSLSSASLETPQARPFASNRVQNEAQTGISLLNNQPRRRLPPSRQNHASNYSSNDEHKENIEDGRSRNVSEHVYDQPLQVQDLRGNPQISEEVGKREREFLIQRKYKHNLAIQLRDAIAHVDLASENLRKKNEQLEKCMKRKLDLKLKELDEEYRIKEETLQEENERLQRGKRELEREKKILQKRKGEREKELSDEITKLREKNIALETQNSKLRQDKRTLNEEIKKKDEEIEKIKKEYSRKTNICQTLEKHIKQLRADKERDEKDRALFARVAENRKSPHQTIANQSLGSGSATISSTSSRNPSVSSLTGIRKNPTSKGRTVSFADDPQEQSLEVIQNLPQVGQMIPFETISTKFGPSTKYCDSFGKTTKVSSTIANGMLFEFHNGDFRWINRQNSVHIYRYAVDKTIVIHLAQFGISIIYSLQRQLEVFRPANNVTLISVKRQEIRTELYGHDDGSFSAETYDRSGRFVTKDYVHPEVIQVIKLDTTYSHRDNGSRHVIYFSQSTFDDFELVEPEFRLRWYKGKTMVCKIIKRPGSNEKTLRVEVDLATGNGILETVDAPQKDVVQKQTVFPWSDQKLVTAQ